MNFFNRRSIVLENKDEACLKYILSWLAFADTYLGVRIAIPSNVTTASSPPAPTSAIDIILSRNTWQQVNQMSLARNKKMFIHSILMKQLKQKLLELEDDFHHQQIGYWNLVCENLSPSKNLSDQNTKKKCHRDQQKMSQRSTELPQQKTM